MIFFLTLNSFTSNKLTGKRESDSALTWEPYPVSILTFAHLTYWFVQECDCHLKYLLLPSGGIVNVFWVIIWWKTLACVAFTKTYPKLLIAWEYGFLPCISYMLHILLLILLSWAVSYTNFCTKKTREKSVG